MNPDSSPRLALPRWLPALASAAFLILAFVILAWGAWKRFQLPQAPLVDPDVPGYLGPAMFAFAGRHFIHISGRSFPYPLFVWTLLRLFHDFRAISIVQHILGLAAGAFLILAWDAMLALVPPGGIPRSLSRFIGLGPAAIYLGSAAAIRAEHELRPEAVFPCVVMLQVWITFLFCRNRFLLRRPAICSGAFNAFLAILLYLLKPSFGFAILTSTAPVWLSLFIGPRQPARVRLLLITAALLPAALLLILPEAILRKTDRFGPAFVPETLFTIHARIIDDQLARDLASSSTQPYPRPVLEAAHAQLDADLQSASLPAAKPYPSLGFSPDELMYHSFCINFPYEMHWTQPQACAFYMYCFRHAIARQPGAFLQKVLRQLHTFYNPQKFSVYHLGQTVNATDVYARTPQVIAGTARMDPGFPPMTAYLAQCARLASRGVAFTQVKRLTNYTRFLSLHYFHLLAIAILSPLLLLIRPLRAHIAWPVAALWFAHSYNFANSLTIALTHSLDVTRYIRTQFIFTLLAEVVSLWFIAETLAFIIRLLLGHEAAEPSVDPETPKSPSR